MLPFGAHGTHFKTGLVGEILGDWEVNGILRWATGTPYTVTADPLACACLGAASVPATFTNGTSINGASSFNPTLFALPRAGTFGALSRNGFRGPDLFVYNLAVSRNFSVRENFKLQFRGEAYNLTNTSNLANPVSHAMAPGFGTTPGTLNGEAGRQFQVAARLLF